MVRLVVVGGSFSGLELLHQLRGRPESITLVDSRPEHSYTPLLHEGITGRLSDARLQRPYRGWVEKTFEAQFVQGRVRAVEPGASGGRVVFDDGRDLGYDALVIAAGSVHRLDDVRRDGAQVHISAVKFAGDLLVARKAVGAKARRITVVGNGLTGVEHAAELALAARKSGLATEVRLAGREELPLAFMARGLRERAAAALTELGVKLTSEPLSAPPETPGNAERAEEVFIWATGTTPVKGFEGLPRTEGGFVRVDQRLRVPVPGHVFAIGDLAQIHDDAGSIIPTTMRAAEAIFQGAWLGKNLTDLLRGSSTRQYRAELDFPFYGVSLGPRAIFAYRRFGRNTAVGAVFRRFLLSGYWKRLGPLW